MSDARTVTLLGLILCLVQHWELSVSMWCECEGARKKLSPSTISKQEISSSSVETPTKTSPLQRTLYLVMAVTLILGTWARLVGIGWILIFIGIPLLFLAILHLMFQVWAIRRVSKMKPAYIPLILLSNLFFFLGFALQVDFGDEGGAYLAIVSLYDLFFKPGARDYIAAGQFNTYVYASIGFLAALIVSWFFYAGSYSLNSRTAAFRPDMREPSTAATRRAACRTFQDLVSRRYREKVTILNERATICY